jgi:hypothetical protein
LAFSHCHHCFESRSLRKGQKLAHLGSTQCFRERR